MHAAKNAPTRASINAQHAPIEWKREGILRTRYVAKTEHGRITLRPSKGGFSAKIEIRVLGLDVTASCAIDLPSVADAKIEARDRYLDLLRLERATGAILIGDQKTREPTKLAQPSDTARPQRSRSRPELPAMRPAELPDATMPPPPQRPSRSRPRLETAATELTCIQPQAASALVVPVANDFESEQLADRGPEARAGDVIGGYHLESLLGAGATSQVFLATHVRLGRAAAIKVLPQTLLRDKDIVARFLQEGRVVNDIHHPNIVDIIDFVDTENPRRVALVMEHIAGPSLKQLRDVRLTAEQAFDISLQLVDAVEAAHRAGVIHRDIKPENLLLARDPRTDPNAPIELKVVDFGIAKLAGKDGRTAAGIMLGTPAYMAPEQIAGSPAVTTAADVFAIGAVIYELFTGRRAYPDAEIHETVHAKLQGEIPPLEVPAISGGERLLALVRRCLASKPEDRPMLEEVREVLASLARPPSSDGPIAHDEHANARGASWRPRERSADPRARRAGRLAINGRDLLAGRSR